MMLQALVSLLTLSLLVMYVLTNVAAIRFLRRGPEALLPAAGIGVAGYVLTTISGWRRRRRRRSTCSPTS